MNSRCMLFPACVDDADHPVRLTLAKQAAEKAAAFLLGGLPQIRRERKTQARDDSCGVGLDCFGFTF